MKTITLSAIAAALVFSLPVAANDAHHPAGTGAATNTPVPQDAAKLEKMQENVKRMQSQLDRIAKAKTDAERQKAMAEHMHTMKENMHMAHGMHGGAMECPMMEGGAKGKGMMGKGMMEKRMEATEHKH